MKSVRLFLRRHSKFADASYIILLCAIYLAILLPHLWSDGAYFDEGFSSYLARLDPLSIGHYTALDVHPPLYYVVLSAWQHLVGFNVGLLRFLSVFWAWISIWALFGIVRSLVSRRSAYIATILVALTPIFVRYGEALRMYTMAIALVLIATYILVYILTKLPKRPMYLWALYALVAAAAIWTNYFTVFGLLAHGTWLLTIRKREWGIDDWKRWLLAGTGAAILYIPWLPALVEKVSAIQSGGFWIPPISLQTLLSTFTLSTVYRSVTEAHGLLIAVAIYGVVALVLVVVTFRSASRNQRSKLLLLLLLGVFPIVGLILISLPPLHPAYVHRYALGGVVVLAALVGACIGSVKFRSSATTKTFAICAVFVAVLLIGVGQFNIVGNRNLDTGAQSTVAQSLSTVKERGRGGEPIVTYSGYTYFALSLYDTSEHPVWLVNSPGLQSDPTTRVLVEKPLHLVSAETLSGSLSYWQLDDVSGAPVHVIQSVKIN